MESCAECPRMTKALEQPWRGIDKADERSWNQYIALHGFQDVWDDSQHRAEQDRYGRIVAHLEACEEQKKATQRETVREREYWAIKMRRGPHCLGALEGEVQEIIKAADAVQLEWAHERTLQDHHEREVNRRRNSQGGPWSQKKVRIGEWGDEDAKEVTVATNLSENPKYYLGHAGGDYIFRYREEEVADPFETSSEQEILDIRWEELSSGCGSSILGSDPGDQPWRFTYCGQVPRPFKEYMARLQVVIPAWVNMMVSLVGFHRGGGTAEPLDPRLRAMAGLDMASSREELYALVELWINEFADRAGAPPETIRNRLRRSAKPTELAYLLRMASLSCFDALEKMAPIIELLQISTGWSLFHMVDMEDVRTSRRALHELLHERKFEHVLVIEVDDVRVSWRACTLGGDAGGGDREFLNPARTAAEPDTPILQYIH